MIPLAAVAAFLPPASSKIFYRDDLITLWGYCTEKYAVSKVDGEMAFIIPVDGKGKPDWWKMCCFEFAGFMA